MLRFRGNAVLNLFLGVKLQSDIRGKPWIFFHRLFLFKYVFLLSSAGNKITSFFLVRNSFLHFVVDDYECLKVRRDSFKKERKKAKREASYHQGQRKAAKKAGSLCRSTR